MRHTWTHSEIPDLGTLKGTVRNGWFYPDKEFHAKVWELTRAFPEEGLVINVPEVTLKPIE